MKTIKDVVKELKFAIQKFSNTNAQVTVNGKPIAEILVGSQSVNIITQENNTAKTAKTAEAAKAAETVVGDTLAKLKLATVKVGGAETVAPKITGTNGLTSEDLNKLVNNKKEG